jgi:hypothetical protein
MSPVKRLLPLALVGCVNFEPYPGGVDRQIHALQAPSTQYSLEVSYPLWPDEVEAYVQKKESDGWHLHDQYPAGGETLKQEVPDAIPSWWSASNFTPSKVRELRDDPLRRKIILVFRRAAS